ncbi:MAG: hypothetical protein L0191_04735, partial [Acidobacteria bacterium]|nr:hypothetical protein [Acidobacteriota bacterium]
MDAVTTFGHVRDKPTLEIPITEAGDFLKEGDAQTNLEPSPEAQYIRSHTELEEKMDYDKDDQRPYGAKTLFAKTQLPAEVEQPPEQQGLDDDATGCESQHNGKGSRGQETIGTQEPKEFMPWPTWRLGQGRRQFRGERGHINLTPQYPVCGPGLTYRAPLTDAH